MVRPAWNIHGYVRQNAVTITRSGINPLVAVLLASRGTETPEDARRAIADDLSLAADPMLLRDMDKAVRRIARAVERQERTAVYGDYDVDGITSASLLTAWLKKQGLDCLTYIPERLDEGYGIKRAGIDYLHSRGVKLIISTDCGITASDEAAYAAGLGMDMIITDHHECGRVLPDAVAVVNPKRPDCPYPTKSLAGVGVAFKLVCACEGSDRLEELLEQYGDLVALGTIADVMPVPGENRLFIRRGLENIHTRPRPGIRALCEAAGLDWRQLSAMNVSYGLAPRINAAGRLSRTELATELLQCTDEQRAQHLAAELCQLNRDRQKLESEMFLQASEMVNSAPDGPLVLVSDRWHQGVSGIVASRLAEKFGVPAIMICVAEGIGKGSCRSVRGFGIYEALSCCADTLESFGGHEMAAGLTIKSENIPVLAERLRAIYEKKRDSITESCLEIDFEVIKPGLLTEENVESLKMLEPYGLENPQPLLCMSKARVESIIPLSGGKHSKLRVNHLGETYDCVFFSRGPGELGLDQGGLADIAFTPQINEFRGRRSVQLLLSDIVPSD